MFVKQSTQVVSMPSKSSTTNVTRARAYNSTAKLLDLLGALDISSVWNECDDRDHFPSFLNNMGFTEEPDYDDPDYTGE
jgi:hypothetical protein